MITDSLPTTVFCDFAEALDWFDHEIMITKLENYGIRGVPSKMFVSYVECGKKLVGANSKVSSQLPGSSCMTPWSGLNIQTLHFTIGEDLITTKSWSDTNGLCLNTNKTLVSSYKGASLVLKINSDIIILLFVGYSQATFRLFGKDSIASKAADFLGMNNLIRVDGDARAKVFGNEVGVDAAVGISKDEAGAHAGGNADVLGQKLNLHADILDGHEISQRIHQVYRDDNGRQYVLQPDYIGSKKVYRRKYLDDGVYLDKGNDNGSNGATNRIDKVSINSDNQPKLSAGKASEVYFTGNNGIPSNPVDDESVVIRGDDDTEYWVRGNNGKLIRTHVNNDEAIPQQNGEYYYHFE
ncbi:uncharacterized protein LOC130893023 [Diorhabda carinulata]|uniref:uncharacterized protein LOC130893023 n=1 Tax=Diorhabda carinulata TaxID=1163345 RepID=UPI0025A0EC10|nr:uncharacterized protein LOC130893023 [Diorhabda carinulata]